jgi:hypothetical protein
MKNPLSSNRQNITSILPLWPRNQSETQHAQKILIVSIAYKRLTMDPKVELQHDHQNITYLHVLVPCIMPDNMLNQLVANN